MSQCVSHTETLLRALNGGSRKKTHIGMCDKCVESQTDAERDSRTDSGTCRNKQDREQIRE
eukprot:1475594-Prymnesium_polylepis.2